MILKLSLNDDSSKLFFYSKLKSDIKLEEYLNSERNFKNRQLLTKYPNLEIELGLAKIFHEIKDIVNFVKHWMTNSTFSLILKLLIILDLPLLIL